MRAETFAFFAVVTAVGILWNPIAAAVIFTFGVPAIILPEEADPIGTV